MSNNTNTEILIDYLDGNLSEVEKNKVSNSLQDDTLMQEELNNLLLAKSAIQYYGIKQQVSLVANKFVAKQKNISSTPKPSLIVKFSKWSLRIAASLLIVAIGIAAYQYSNITTDKLFADNFSEYNLSVTRGENTAIEMEKAFYAKDYQTVIKIGSTKSLNQKEYFILGQSYIKTNSYQKAVECFSSVIKINSVNDNAIFNDDAAYYLAMSYLKNKQLDLAYPIFEMINKSGDHLYNDKVTNAFMRKLKILKWKL